MFPILIAGVGLVVGFRLLILRILEDDADSSSYQGEVCQPVKVARSPGTGRTASMSLPEYTERDEPPPYTPRGSEREPPKDDPPPYTPGPGTPTGTTPRPDSPMGTTLRPGSPMGTPYTSQRGPVAENTPGPATQAPGSPTGNMSQPDFPTGTTSLPGSLTGTTPQASPNEYPHTSRPSNPSGISCSSQPGISTGTNDEIVEGD